MMLDVIMLKQNHSCPHYGGVTHLVAIRPGQVTSSALQRLNHPCGYIIPILEIRIVLKRYSPLGGPKLMHRAIPFKDLAL
jgi:hypothetical protein